MPGLRAGRGGLMRLREALILALRYGAELGKIDRTDVLRIEGASFISSEFRGKYGRCPEVRLSMADCLAEDWYLVKAGALFVPPEFRA